MVVLTSLWLLRVGKLWTSAVQHLLMATTLGSWMSQDGVTSQWASTYVLVHVPYSRVFFRGAKFSWNHNQLYYRKCSGGKFSQQASWTHSLAAWTAIGWTEEDSGPSAFGSCPRGIARKYCSTDCCRTTRMHMDLTPRHTYIFRGLNFRRSYSITKNTRYTIYVS